ncbi:MAG: bifunctional demethylmenaquinone methyltransferase/2-methoxy-6-polyprenyl-1,4-benzoquinol methylase UbiE [Planctomycetales bacterium]|nr:bifunctional demethylmenaquinone methyltransferase/2-methoxy-6-polyprenyl-1,4-benzoquinol methylase UbiE [Planctomycetales bacterium]
MDEQLTDETTATITASQPSGSQNGGPIDKSGDRVRRMFAEISPQYDRMNHLLSMQVDRYWRWRTTRLAPPRGTTPILDACTGTGDLALAYWRAGGGRVPVVASDFCEEMLAIGQAKRERAGIDSEALRFVQADTQQLPFDGDQFQIVSVAFGLRNVQDTDRGLAEMTRVCVGGGRVVILEFSAPTWQPLKACYGFYFRNILPRIGQLLARNNSAAYNYLPESVGEFPAGEALATRMRAAGLSDVTFYPLTGGIATLYVGQKAR